MRQDLPAGTVTFLFTDIEGSTALLEELGSERYGELLSQHHRVCRAAWAAHGGVEVDTTGDAFFVAFPTASGVLAAAADAQRALAELGLQVRMGVHTGEVSLNETGYVGLEVHRAARIAAAAHGGQVVVSGPAAAEAGRDELVDLGEHRFKDVEEPMEILQLGEGSFPPLKTISNTNLPRPASSFVGRDRELAEVLARVEQGARLVTLTGPGGSGKTRLALEAAATLVPQYKAGVFWVGLAALRDPALVTETIAQTLGAKDDLAGHIGERELLLLLDNLEQVIESAPELSALLRTCPNLILLVTSRELLRVDGEVEYAVPPLAQPEAVSLFCERAQVDPTDEIAELCARLDNLPLAVELAAARTKVLSPAQILERLSQRLDLLKGGRDADPRQQTLRATIEWSHDLLTDDEQRLFRALSVFSGGCTLDAAERVADADVDTLQSLVEKSLLRFTNERYWMLETIREYAADLLATLAEKRDLRRAHARHYAKLFASQSDAVRRWDESAHASVVDEFDNARAALDWAVARGDEQTTARVVAGLWFLWLVRGNGSEATAAAESLLRFDLDLNEPDSLFGAAAASEILRATGERERALAIKRRCLVATYKRPNAAFFGDRVSILTIPLITDIASLECELGDLVSAHNHASDALAKRRQVGRESGIAHALCVMSQVALYEGDPEVAAEHLEEALKLYLAVGQETEALGVRISLAECLLLSGEVDTAIDELRSYIDGAVRADAYYGAEVARIVSTLAAQRGRPGDSARLAGFHSEALARAGLSAGPREQALLERGQQPVRSALEHDYDEFVADGRRLDLDDVVVLSLKVLA